jgi:serine/threonine protein kinase
MTKLDVKIPGYQVLTLLSSGYECSVYQARAEDQVSLLAIKIANTQRGAASLRFEIALMKACTGVSGLMPLITSGQTAERDFLVMPFCGKTLGEIITSHSHTLSSQQSIRAILQLLTTLQALHQHGFVHGDIHPDNLFFDQLEYLVLSDFGNAISIATPREEALHVDAVVKGASPFASPEQQRAQSPISASDDLYSLTLVLCAMLSSRLEIADIRAWCESERENFSSDLFEIIDKGMHIQPECRFQSAADFKTALLALDLDDLRTNEAHAHEQAPQQGENAGDMRQDKPTGEAYQQITTEPFCPEIKLNAHTQSLQQKINEALKLQGYVRSEQKNEWLKTYLTFDDIDDPASLLEALIAESKVTLQQQGLEAWFEWTEDTLHELSSASYVLNETDKKRMKQHGLRIGAASERHLDKWLQAHSKASEVPSSKRLVFILLSLLAGVVMAFAWFTVREPAAVMHSNEQIKLDENDGFASPKMSDGDNASSESVSTPTGLSPEPGKQAQDSVQKPDAQRTMPMDPNIKTVTLIDNKTQETYSFELRRVVSQNEAIFVMTQEVTNALWQVCVNAGRCRSAGILSTDPQRKRLNLPTHPVINISWHDVTEDFIPFINEASEHNFALPSMSEWLSYAFSSEGEALIPRQLHCLDCENGLQNEFERVSMPSASLRPGMFGLHHTYGNVQEWLQDCWQDVKLQIQRCDQAPAVGGSYLDSRSLIQTRPLNSLLKTARSTTTGFRLVKRETTKN